MNDNRRGNWKSNERGATLVFVALALITLLGVMALAIDLGILYVARNQAQRAADAAALAGADVFYTDGCVSGAGGCVAGGSQEALAATQALNTASRNTVAGQSASIDCPEYADPSLASTSCPGISFAYPSADEPQITVTVERSGIQTIFAQVFGASAGTVSATASAEAYSPEGGQANSTPACVAPFLVPNCDPNQSSPQNTVCPNTSPAGYFTDPNVSPVALDYSAVGTQWDLHFGSAGPSDSAIPSEWYLVAIWPSGNPSGQQVQNAIQECIPVTCGESLPAIPGKKVGKVDTGVEDRIDASGASTGCPSNCNFTQGKDTITAQPGQSPGYQISAGSNNPLVIAGDATAGAAITTQQSPSVVTVAMYDGAICGTTEPDGTVETTSNSDCIGPGGGTVTVVGWMSLFLEGYYHGANYDGVQSMILSITPCGSGTLTGGTGGTLAGDLAAPGTTPIPIRLIQHAN